MQSSTCWLIIASMLVIVLFVPEFAYASEDSTMKNTFDIFNIVLQFLSWVWIVPAILAWELLSNDLVFWSSFNFEIYLWRIWTIMRSFANFFIWWLFLYYLLMHIVKSVQGATLWDFFNKILRLFLATILVNASFFLIRAVVDISIVATTAISSLPHAIIESRWLELKPKMTVNKMFCIEDYAPSFKNCDREENKEVWLTSILPQADNMWWPILFMGVAMLDLLNANVVPIDIKNRENLALATVMKVLMILFFTAPILALMIVNMFRIFYIRLRTIFSPFIVLDLVMWQENSPLKWIRGEWGKWWLAYNGLWDILWLIFVPVAVVWTLAIWFILLLWLMSVIKWWAAYESRAVNSIQITNNPPTISVPHVMNIWVEWSLFQRTAFRTLGFFGEALMLFFSMAILWWIVKVWFSTSSIAKRYSDQMFDAAAGFAKSIPLAPIAWGMSWSSIQNAWWVGWVLKGVSWLQQREDISRATAQERTNKLLEWLWISWWWYENDIDPSVLAKINWSAWIQSNVNSIRKALVDKDGNKKTNIRYAWNVKAAFEKMNASVLLQDYFPNLDPNMNAETLHQTEAWRDFVKDVIEWDGNIPIRSSRYRNSNSSTLLKTDIFNAE